MCRGGGRKSGVDGCGDVVEGEWEDTRVIGLDENFLVALLELVGRQAFRS